MTKRQRIEGSLHRSLPAVLTIRQDEAAGGEDGLLRLRLSVSSEAPYLRTSWWDDPWIEVLGHKEGEVDLSRLNGGAAVLGNHDRYTPIGNTPLAGIGASERAWLDGERLIVDLALSRRDALADLRQDIADGLVRNVSIGYQIGERVLTRAAGEGQADEYRVTSWTPFEISLVDIPADATVGLGRSAEHQPNTPRYRVVDLPAEGATLGDRSMTTAAATPAAPTTPAAPQQPEPARAADIQLGADPLAGERERMREIRAMGREFGQVELADTAIDTGTSVDAFRAQLLRNMRAAGTLRPAESPEIGMTRAEVEQYSFCRALLAASDPVNAHKLAPFELECSRAAQDKRGDSRDKSREAALTLPLDVLARGITINDQAAARAAANLIGGLQRGARQYDAYRDLVVGTAAAGGNLVATELLGSSFIELLRNAMVLDRMGITWLRDLNGNIAIPSQTGASTAYWLAESGAPTESQQTIGQVGLTPKTVGAFTDYSRRLLLQSSIDIEAFVRADLAAIIGQAIQLAAINGSGASNEPTGLLNTSGIGSVPGGTNGAAPTYDHMVDLETAVANANADVGALGYLTNSKVRGKLRKTQEFASTNGKAVWTSTAERGMGDVLGYGATVTNAVPSNLTKGTSAGVCSAIAFGNWADMVIGMWGGLDIMLDPYTGATSGTRRVIALQDVDVQLRRVASFAAMKDALTS
ncbi:MAG: phage major capsid protein [Rhodocyclaceae bacterium]|nr:phage major capsid protein [Rhodocyclaceae bacterium]